MGYISEKEARESLTEAGRIVYERGFVAANDGNISVRISDDEILITPTGVSKGFMEPGMMVRMKLDGTVIGEGKASSECRMHLRVYRDCKEVHSVVHAHPVYATAFSVIGMSLDHPVVAEGVLVTGNISLARYAEPGTDHVPESIAPYIKGYNGALLENHGVITWGNSVQQAVFRMEAVEHQAKIYAAALELASNTGKTVRYFSEDERNALVRIRERMGVFTGGMPN